MAKREILPYRSHFVRDWAMSETVRVMNFAARGIYQALLDMQWENESIPESPDQCRRLIGCDAEEWAAFEPFLDQCFPIGEDGRRRNPRTAHERHETELRWEKQRLAGQASGKSRSKGKPAPSQAKAEPERKASDPKASDEQMLNGCSTDVEQALNHTNTDTFTLANASGASDDDAEVIEAEVIEAEVIEAEIVQEPSEPYATVERVLMAMDGKPVPASKVRRYLREDSPIRGLVAQYGEADATRLIIWAAKHKRLNVATVYGSSGVLWDEAVACNWGPPGAMKGKAPGDRERVLMEAVGLG